MIYGDFAGWHGLATADFVGDYCALPKTNSKLARGNPPEEKERIVFQGLGGGFKHFLFSPLFGEDFQFD